MERILPILLFLVSLQVFGQSNVEKYFKALEQFDFQTAYSYVHESEQRIKPFEEFEKDHPLIVLEGFRMVDENFFRFEVIANEAKEGKYYAVKTLAMMRNKGDRFRKINSSMKKKSSKEGVTYSPEYVQNFANKNPEEKKKMFREVTWSIQEVDGGVMLGWKEEAEEKAAYEEDQRVRKIEFDAQKYAMMGDLSGGYQLKEAIEGLKGVQDQIPESYLITHTLPDFEKHYNIIQKLKISIDLAKQNEDVHSFVADIENNSDKKIARLTLWYEFKDEGGKILLKIPNDIPQSYSDFNLSPIHPGYKGEFKFGMPSSTDYELIKKSNSVTIDIKWILIQE